MYRLWSKLGLGQHNKIKLVWGLRLCLKPENLCTALVELHLMLEHIRRRMHYTCSESHTEVDLVYMWPHYIMLKFELEMISMCSFLAKIKLLHHMHNYWSLVLLLYILRKIRSSKSQAGQWSIQKCIPMDSLACVLLKKEKKTGKIKSIISSAFSLYKVVLDTMWPLLYHHHFSQLSLQNLAEGSHLSTQVFNLDRSGAFCVALVNNNLDIQLSLLNTSLIQPFDINSSMMSAFCLYVVCHYCCVVKTSGMLNVMQGRT